MKKMLSLSDGKDVCSIKWLQNKLKELYGDHLIFAEVNGKHNVLCFKNIMNYIINNKWYQERSLNIDDEAERVIKTTAKLICEEIRQMTLENEVYPSPEDIKNSAINNSWCPKLLRTLLAAVVANVMKQSSIGQSIIKAARPCTAIPPILFGIGVEADHMFESRWLIDELFRLGFSISYSEVNRFRQSVTQSKVIFESSINPYPKAFTQWIGDNVDHNLVTLDGSGSFHGMGVIATSN